MREDWRPRAFVLCFEHNNQQSCSLYFVEPNQGRKIFSLLSHKNSSVQLIKNKNKKRWDLNNNFGQNFVQKQKKKKTFQSRPRITLHSLKMS